MARPAVWTPPAPDAQAAERIVAERTAGDPSLGAVDAAAAPDADGPDAPRAAAAPDRPAPPAVRDVAQAVLSARDGERVALRLDPPELGRVIIDIALADGAVSATVSAERPETLDLLRRHAEALQRELMAAGFQSADLAFGGRNARSGDDAQPGAVADDADAAPIPAAAPAAGPARVAGGRLDLRL